jgi:hypothetical protein
VDIASLVVFRVMFGVLMAYDVGRYVVYGWVHHHYVDVPMTFKYIGFLWVDVLPGPLMYAAFGVMVGAALAISLGAFYRLSCFLFFLGHTYVFLVGAEFYLNHAYLISVVAFMMIFVPAHRAMSIDAIRVPGLYSTKIHAWPLILIGGMIGVVYTYGAIAKMNADWLIGYEPIRHWLGYRADTAVEPVAGLLRTERVVAIVAWGGTLLDLLITPALVWRRTRVAAVVISYGFHLSNAYLFNIGIFPWFMIAVTTVFFDPSWPRKLKGIGPRISHYIDDVVPEDFEEGADNIAISAVQKKRITMALAGFFAVMLLVPLRHHLYPGPVAWSEEGHYFSWRMKLRDKQGTVLLRVKDPATGNEWTLDPRGELSDRQVRKIAGRPDMLLQYVHFVRDRYEENDGMNVEIYADVHLSLNYREEQRFIDPTVDLAKVDHSLAPYPWINAFEDTPLPSPVLPVKSSLSRAATRIRVIARQHTGRIPRLPVRRTDEERLGPARRQPKIREAPGVD